MSDNSFLQGPNAGYVAELYDRYRQDPESVDAETRALFAYWTPPAESAAPAAVPTTTAPTRASLDIPRIVGAARLARLIRELGHLAAHVDPLGSAPPGDSDLELSTHGLTTEDLAALPPSVVGGPLAQGAENALEAMGKLRRVYSGSVGYETDHIQIDAERRWMRDAIESGQFQQQFDAISKRDLLERLTEVDTFERYLHQTFQGEKRFSIEGTDMLIPMLDEIIHDAAIAETREVVMGMAHRGRLNVLAHVLGKPYEAILVEFEHAKGDANASVAGRSFDGWTGDVKYHLGARRGYKETGHDEMRLTLVPNPSHLEYVNPVVEGHARAAQERRTLRGEPVRDDQASLPIVIHGDAAFPGQGIIAETLNLSSLPGYRTGGTIHIIVNNQIGFTTLPSDARSTLYAGDLAKGFEIPIVHVNADDPEACIAVARMAHDYCARFHKDFLIDLVGYRRYGHNEGDEPAFTQPRMVEIIANHPRVRDLWAQELERQGIVTRDESEAMVKAMQARLQQARAMPPRNGNGPTDDGLRRISRTPAVETALSVETLMKLNEALLEHPAGFTTNARLERTVFERRRAALQKEGGIDWGHAETLAFASILADCIPIRLTGQDSERGTFNHRHAVLHDVVTGERYVPLQHLRAARASFAIYNSPLSESAPLGFEYGYSMQAPGVLVLWEAQFGDFANSAQVIIDQFLVSGNAKWRQIPSLVLLLPHGYEGQGPEHSSARLERFLQLAANDNIRVVNCTTSAQYFHLLRRQAALLKTDPRPLIVMAPKFLLRHPRAGSSLSDFTHGLFQPVIADAEAEGRRSQITRLVLCSGKIYVDLVDSKNYAAAAGRENIAVVRVEELYPFPEVELREIVAGYPHLQEIVWMQEEPCNMGAWTYMAPRLRELVGWTGELLYVGRPEAASPAEGSKSLHAAEQERILTEALRAIPSPPVKRSEVEMGVGR
jgi:2-oxoglutarate dehydrogenase E1 component